MFLHFYPKGELSFLFNTEDKDSVIQKYSNPMKRYDKGHTNYILTILKLEKFIKNN